jgi:putative cofactor-binding repeat protein/predicted outer membrane repeat protein
MTRRLVTAAAVAALIALTMPAAASADDVTATAFDDHPLNGCTPADCTLREAVDQLENFETVTLLAGRYQLTQGTPLVLELDVELVGQGARATTIDATGASRVAYLVGGSANVNVRGVTVTGGDARDDTIDPGQGGAFRVDEASDLTLEQSAVVGNVAGENGGGISSDGALTVEESVISGNGVAGGGTPRGGGIYIAFGGDLTMSNSTVSGNTVTDTDGADARGGGIYAEDEFALEHATIAANRAVIGGGVYQASTFSGNSMTNTLVAANTGGACAGDASLIETDHTLADDGTCALNGSGDLPPGNARLAPLGNYGGPTNTHALYTGSPAINGSNNCGAPDQRGVVRLGAPCDIGAYEGSIAPPGSQPPPPPPPSPPPPDDQLPPPVAGESGNVLPASGTVKVKLPGTNKYVVLAEGQQIPMGTIVDTRNGGVRLVVASNKSGGTSTALFYAGILKLSQSKGSRPITTLTLVEKMSCPRSGKASAAAKKKKRRLWGDGKGRFRTKGKHSAATVLGTKWLVEDRCTSTLTRVVRGKVSVRDFAKRKTVVVRAGKKYLARRR